jgi:N-methylhydantoinase A
VVGARFAAERSDVGDFVSLDMGGTSNDVAVVRDGKPLITSGGFIGPYPVRAPMVDVSTIGAGGGSIAWIDGAGGLRVGPVSAGADPGPACYGRGGHQATVTDANLLLGYLDPERFADGLMRLDRVAATLAVGAVAGKLGLETMAAAAGIHRVINARMADQIRLVTIKRGYDPRQFALVVLGGAGPVHGVALAEEMGMAEVIVPEAPGVLAAFGLLAAAIEHHHARTLHCRADDVDLDAVNRCLADLDEAGLAWMREEGVPLSGVEVSYAADMRYVGQAYELEVAIEAPMSQARVANAVRGFHEAHERVYGYARAQQPVELVNFSALHRYPLPRPVLHSPAPAVGVVGDARIGERRAYFAPAGFVPTALYDRARLPLGSRLAGPAIVEQADSTSVIPPGHVAVVEASGNLRIRRRA